MTVVTLPGVTGKFGVYAGHPLLATQTVPGEIEVRKGGHDLFLLPAKGSNQRDALPEIEVSPNRVSVLTTLPSLRTALRGQSRRSNATRGRRTRPMPRSLVLWPIEC